VTNEKKSKEAMSSEMQATDYTMCEKKRHTLPADGNTCKNQGSQSIVIYNYTTDKNDIGLQQEYEKTL